MTFALVRAGVRPAAPEGDGGASVAALRFPHPDPQLPASCQRPQGPHGSPPPPRAAPGPLGGHGAQRTHGDISPIHLRCHPLGDTASGDIKSLGTLLTTAQVSPHCRDPVPIPTAARVCLQDVPQPARLAPCCCATVAWLGMCVAPVFSCGRFSSQNSAAARGTVTQGCDHGPTAPRPPPVPPGAPGQGVPRATMSPIRGGCPLGWVSPHGWVFPTPRCPHTMPDVPTGDVPPITMSVHHSGRPPWTDVPTL